jgi:hypothetical protein
MANTMTLISSVTVGSGGASSIDFTSISATYTDLCLKLSLRGDKSATSQQVYIKFNTSSSSFSMRYLLGDGSSASSGTDTANTGLASGANATSNTFGSEEIYIPNYAGSTNKSFSSDAVSENNATNAYASLFAGLWSNTSAINGITIYHDTNKFVQYSTAYLYGIKNS